MPANIVTSGDGDGTITYDKPIGHLSVFVASGVTFELSLDKGVNYITLPAGFNSFPIGAITEVRVVADGEWQILAVQA
jgi:hypothetical protein